MKYPLTLLSGLILAVMLSACSSTKEDNNLNYRQSEITPTLEIPPDLTQLSSRQNLNLPGSKVGLPENSGRFVETGNLNVEVRTLPVIEGITIQGRGDLHWLSVPEKAEVLYPRIRTFWAEQGFRLQKDEPAIGVMETEWLTTRSGSDSFFSSILASLAGAESKDQYKTRFERSNNNTSTDIFLVHRGQELLIDDPDKPTVNSAGRSSGWQIAPADPSKEYEMLSRLMLFLGLQDEAVEQELEKLGLFASRARIEYDQDEEETYLVVSQGYQQTWNRLLHQLDRLSIDVLERDKDDNSGEVKVLARAFLSSEPEERDQSVSLSLEGSSNANQTRIDVHNEDGVLLKSEQARQILQNLLQQLK